MHITDWLLPLNSPGDGYYFTGDARATPVAGDNLSLATKLVERCLYKRSKADIQAWTEEIDSVIYRIQIEQDTSGTDIAAIRVIEAVKSLSELHVPSNIIELLLHKKMNAGLILICGAAGTGKSTTAIATIIDRLSKSGGYSLILQDPVEHVVDAYYPESGGLCVQINVDPSADSYSRHLRTALRMCPAGINTQVLVGEIRDNATAAEALQAGINGHLIITTFHGSSITDAIRRLASMASGVLGEESAYDLIGSALRLVIHQTLDNRQLTIQTLIASENSVESKIKNQQIDQLSTDLQRQNNLLTIGRSLKDLL